MNRATSKSFSKSFGRTFSTFSSINDFNITDDNPDFSGRSEYVTKIPHPAIT